MKNSQMLHWEAAKEVFFSGLTLTPFKHSGHIFSEVFFRASKNIFYLSGQVFTPPPSTPFTGPTTKNIFLRLP